MHNSTRNNPIVYCDIFKSLYIPVPRSWERTSAVKIIGNILIAVHNGSECWDGQWIGFLWFQTSTAEHDGALATSAADVRGRVHVPRRTDREWKSGGVTSQRDWEPYTDQCRRLLQPLPTPLPIQHQHSSTFWLHQVHPEYHKLSKVLPPPIPVRHSSSLESRRVPDTEIRQSFTTSDAGSTLFQLRTTLGTRSPEGIL